MASQGPHRDDPRVLTELHITRLRELDRVRTASGAGGIGLEVDELIERLAPKTAPLPTAGATGVPHPLLLVNAKRLFDLGIGPEVGKRLQQGVWSLEAYLATLPAPCPQCVREAEASARGPATGLFHYCLVETRAGLVVPCEAGKIAYGGNDETFVPYNGVPVEGSYWALFHPGEAHLGKLPRDSRTAIVAARDIPASAIDGVCARLFHADVVTELKDNPAGRAMDLTGSVHAADSGDTACLDVFEGQAKLYWYWDARSYPRYGGAFRRECAHLAR